jgi:hydroxymethylglutaryl-CoA lyase
VPQSRVVDLALRLAEAEPVEIALADTIGVAAPAEVGDLFARLREALPAGTRLRGHFHDTRGTAVANAWAAWQAGAEVLDGALGGLGGCPFAPGAAGNVATEDLIYLFERAGLAIGIDLAAAVAANAWLSGVMEKPLPSRVAKAWAAAPCES